MGRRFANPLDEVAALRAKHGRDRHRVAIPSYAEARPVALSNTLAVAGGYKRCAQAHRWQRGRAEAAETVREMEAKALRVAPLFNKGAYGYLSPGTDPTTIGRK